MAFSKSLPSEQIPLGCELCEVGNKIGWKCTDCNLFMCNRCKDTVHLRIAQDHKVVNIKEISQHGGSWTSFVFSNLKCEDHSNQPCSLYCKTCSTVICLKCVVKAHNGHTFVDEDELNDKKDVLQEGQRQIRKKLSKLNTNKWKMMAPEETENPKLAEVKQNILDHKKKLIKAVECYADNLVQDAYQHYGDLKQEEETRTDKDIENLHGKNEALQTIITSRDFKKFLFDFDNLYSSLNEDLFQDNMTVSSFPNFVPAEFTVFNFGSLEGKKRFRENHSQIKFKVTNQWTTDLRNIHYITRCLDGSLWIADNKNEVLQHVKLENDNVKVLSSFSMQIFGLVDISNNIFVSTRTSILKSVNERTKQIKDSAFNVYPMTSRDVHITRDRKVIISAISSGSDTRRSTSSLIVIDQAGKLINKHERDRNNKRLFTLPYKVTSTRNGNICVVDRIYSDGQARVVVIGQEGKIKGVYTGHQYINTEDKPFKPQGILATPADNILVTDWDNHGIHILTRDGEFILFYSLKDIGIQYPFSLAMSTSGKIFIGCTEFFPLPFLKYFRGKLYEVEYSLI